MSSVEIHRMFGGGSSFCVSELQEKKISVDKRRKGRKIFMLVHHLCLDTLLKIIFVLPRRFY
jgi:hypothetical protein